MCHAVIERGSEQRLRVIVLGVFEDLARGAFFNDFAIAHDDHIVAQRAHDFEIVADEQIRELALLLQIAQQIDNLRLHAHVERTRWLVQHDKFGFKHHCARNSDALTLAA